jgi:ATP-dependent DNA helicase RecG
LGLIVIDEQHKFGVEQRARFSTGDTPPHVLVMTATPIPRSLCLTQFGDLDVTTVSELPPGRQRVTTSRVREDALRQRAWDFIRRQLAAGRQAYVVCPRIDVTDGSMIGAEEAARRLQSGELRDFEVELVHGQLDRADRSRIMDRFRSGETQVLVSTTVVEVGVDVPNATLMVVYHADRFGLSQLHQLRGRIARGQFQGYCFLFSDTESPEAEARLSALEESSDGFKIAEVDFELRGPGDILGTRQHGTLPLQVADLARDAVLLREARDAAFALVDSGELDSPAFAPLKLKVLDRFSRLMDLPRSG